MSRNNGTFKFRTATQIAGKDESGFYTRPEESEWQNGCECYIEKHIPAKQIIGVDGQQFSYTYEVFIPKHFTGQLELTTSMKLIYDDGSCDEISIIGIDNQNRKYISVWG